MRSDSTVAQLHEVLQIAFGWDDEHLNRFEIRGREYAVYRDGGGTIGIDATAVRLCDLNLRTLERFVYEYDFGDSWIHDLRLETTLPVNPRNIYPLCVAGKCSAPPEDCGGPPGFMTNRYYGAMDAMLAYCSPVKWPELPPSARPSFVFASAPRSVEPNTPGWR